MRIEETRPQVLVVDVVTRAVAGNLHLATELSHETDGDLRAIGDDRIRHPAQKRHHLPAPVVLLVALDEAVLATNLLEGGLEGAMVRHRRVIHSGVLPLDLGRMHHEETRLILHPCEHLRRTVEGQLEPKPAHGRIHQLRLEALLAHRALGGVVVRVAVEARDDFAVREPVLTERALPIGLVAFLAQSIHELQP